MLEFGDVTMTSLAVTAWEVGGKVLPLCGILVKPSETHGNTIISAMSSSFSSRF